MARTVSIPSRGAIFLIRLLFWIVILTLGFRPLSGSYIT